MQTIRWQTEDDIARLDPRSVDHPRTIDYSHDAARQIVFAPAIHPGHLRRFAANQGTAASPTGFGETAQDLIENLGFEFLRPDVVEKEKRPRAEHRDVIDAVVDEIGADGVVPVHGKGDLQLRPDAIDTRDQHRLAHSGKIGREQAAEAADFPEHLGTVRAPNATLDFALYEVTEIDVDSQRGRRLFSSLYPSGAQDFTNLRRHESAKKRSGYTVFARFCVALRITRKMLAMTSPTIFYFSPANKVGCFSSASALARASRFSMMNLSSSGSTGSGYLPVKQARQKLFGSFPVARIIPSRSR